MLGTWGEVWEEIVGRELTHGDPILIPTDVGRLRWENTGSKATRPQPLSLAAYYRVFRKRGAMAGYPWLCATDCTATPDDDGTYTVEQSF